METALPPFLPFLPFLPFPPLLPFPTLAQWAATRGVARAEVMAVGDNLNDVEMLEFAGTAGVMGNASPAMQARGFQLTASNDEHGLADTIRRFILES